MRLHGALTLAAWPLAVLAMLVATDALAWSPALFAAALILAGALVLSRLWTRSWVRDLAQVTARLGRAGAERQAQLGAVLRAEQDLVKRLPDPLITLNQARQVQRSNAAADSAFGSGIGTVLRHPGLRGALDRAQAQATVQSAELNIAMPMAREVLATIIPLDPPLADGSRFVLVLSDRTRERMVERMRADFVANASHELRTPLTSLIGFIDTLRGPAADDPPAQARFLGIMAEQAQRMNRLIDDLLSLSRIELTEHQPPADRVEVEGLVRRAAELFEPRTKARRIKLDLVLADTLPSVLGDTDQLDQVMQNLLDNAIKYGREGGTVRIAAHTAEGRVTVSVSDDGSGVPRAHLPRLTERFYRADKHRSRAVGGTGLGLAIVKHIVSRHRGRLLIDSTEGVGTTVTVSLPVAGSPAERAGSGGAGTA
ncbi:MAG: sensor histidine kinase [Janthinobacterium lividum]